MKSIRQGVTLIELLVVVVWLFSIVSFASWGHNQASWFGLILGIAVGAIAPVLVISGLAFIESFLWGGIPRIPQCRNGVCNKDDYKIVELKDGEFTFQCRCGNYYDKQGRRFVEVDKDGTIRDYLI